MNSNEYVKMKHLLTIVVLITTIILSFFGFIVGTINEIEQKVEDSQFQFMKIESRLSKIQTDLIWIKQSLNHD